MLYGWSKYIQAKSHKKINIKFKFHLFLKKLKYADKNMYCNYINHNNVLSARSEFIYAEKILGIYYFLGKNIKSLLC